MNLKGFAIAIGMLALVGSCAALGACAVATAPVMRVDAAPQYESTYVDLNVASSDYSGYDWKLPYSQMDFRYNGRYFVSGIRCDIQYFYDGDDIASSVFFVSSCEPLICYYSGQSPSMPNDIPWMQVQNLGNVLQFSVNSCAAYVPANYSVPIWAYLTLFENYAYDDVESDLSVYPASVVYGRRSGAGTDYSHPSTFTDGLLTWFKQTQRPIVYAALGNGTIRGVSVGAIINAMAAQHDYDWDEYNELLAEARDAAYTRGYNAGLSASTDSTSAIANLFGAIWNVPVNIINGLSPLVIWNTPIVSVLLTFLVLAIIVFIIRKFI